MKEQIEVAVKWWADQLRHRTKQDNGELIGSMLATLVASDGECEAKVEVFARELTKRLPQHLASGWDEARPSFGSYNRVLETDYRAGLCLSEAAEAAGISPSCPPFPMKTVMWINPDSVRVKHGYAAEVQTLWSNTTGQAATHDASKED